MRKTHNHIFTVILLIVSTVFISCSDSSGGNLLRTKLPNGLHVFIEENHAAPLVYIEIAVRAGAVTQSPENAGLFHLYEHMMFKGNALYPNAAAVQNAMNEIGVASWNGTTYTDCVNYFFTIPKDKLEEGLAFWNAAIRSPLMDEKELENEKEVVLAEIRGDENEPATIRWNHTKSALFPEEPYRTDTGGSPYAVENATVAQLRDIQKKFYIPSNAALFVGGDVNPKETKKLIQKIYGSWSNKGNSVKADSKRPNPNPFSKTEYRVIADENISPTFAEVGLYLRGPDAEFVPQDTYTADLLHFMMDESEGVFKQSLIEDEVLAIPDPAYISSYYITERRSGTIMFFSVLPDPEENLVSRVNHFSSAIKDSVEKLVSDDPSFSKEKIKLIKKRITDRNLLSSESPESLLSTIRFWWTCTDADYYFSYPKMVSKVSQKDAREYFNRYIKDANPLVFVSVHPSVYEKMRSQFEDSGYIEMTSENSFWWKEEKFQSDASKIPTETEEMDFSDIYVPEKKAFSQEKISQKKERKTSTYSLSNGIPVYVEPIESSKVSTVLIGVKGGVLRLTEDTSGLESSLFSVMGTSSENYSYKEREAIRYRTNASFSSMNKLSGSALSLTCVADYLDELMPVLTDGFLNPSYEENVMDLINLGNRQSVQEKQNNPEAYLAYVIAKELFKNSPYSARAGVLPESLENITVENMKGLHEKLLEPSSIFVVATGKVEPKKIIAELDKTIGKISGSGNEAPVHKNIPPVNVSGEPVVLTNPACGEGGFAQRCFVAPNNDEEDYLPCVIAGMLYRELLFNVVRERHGGCYSPNTGLIASHASYGYDFLYRLRDIENFLTYTNEAMEIMKEGKITTGLDDNRDYLFAPVDKKLEGAKSAYIIQTYGSSMTSAALASSLAYNEMQFGNLHYDRKYLEQLDTITSETIMRVFNKYWVESPSRWFVIVAPQNKDKVSF